MKPPIIAVLAACLACASAWANDACEVDLSPATLDYGAITRSELLRSASGPSEGFGRRNVHLRVHCPQARPIKWSFVAPAADSRRYRWEAGTLQVRIVAARLDGVAVQWRLENGQPLEANLLSPGARVVPLSGAAVAQGRYLQVEFEIDAQVEDASSRVADLRRFEGNGAFQID
ncbi:hypothetical protein JRG42_01635 [Pseudomonas granadensis]|uniref:hypothetical protein n=1 Tax=Pseudomonas granadensis TaxID=1421430 RepID=UPI0019D1FD7D|nr:hypothetical protein [Pseudomonas granadensis]MBN6772064.1 hypothetical protein [Pseudomonas granadensis]MBN6803160.1 hypothetical protein [Pseudomonas granadensis]MBN6829915.1 hypothetical protein [Pseudomonas granadensis]MBN6837381.1 hypothetical protein [Pseudomonas granadensis]MBN6866027.1 hypothetical protein [Pseudomonas granadensis]